MRSKIKGFTLLEILLVMVIISMFLYMGMRYYQQRVLQMKIDRTSLQMQQILNAAMSYYVANGKWPADWTALNTDNYLPSGGLPPDGLNGPWGEGVNSYRIGVLKNSADKPTTFYVYTILPNMLNQVGVASAIAGSLPLAYSSGDFAPPADTLPDATKPCIDTDQCSVVGSVNIPGQNLNNATAINYAGSYRHGSCVPVPQCPVDVNGVTMKAKIMLVPTAVSGVNDAGPSGVAPNIYPISSFYAYATPPVALVDGGPLACENGTLPPGGPCGVTNPNDPPDTLYWRVCIDIWTEKGNVAVTNNAGGADAWGQYAVMTAFTRCAIDEEPSGSTFDVFSR